jgi:predicted DCC family thiol-disulfide oxidoreductase YuxK
MSRQIPMEAGPSNARPTVFFDGACPLCCREIAHYRRIDRAQQLRWVDAATEAETLAANGLDLDRVMAELHVLDGTGGWHRGVDAFLMIWSRLPAYRWLARLVSSFGLRAPLKFVYRYFAAWRCRRRCDAGACTAATGTRGR